MAVSKLAALRARVAAKDGAGKEKVAAKVAALSQQWRVDDVKERDDRNKEVQKRREEDAAKRAANPAAAEDDSPGKKQRLEEAAQRKCKCGVQLQAMAVKKEGPNLGRSYLTCAKGKKEFGGCGFFEWAPHIKVADFAATLSADGSVETPKCSCGVEAENRSVKKEGPNLGRGFWSCPTGQKEFGGCGFFAWHPPGYVAAPPTAPAAAAGPVETPKCVCGDKAENRSVKKEGPNLGRGFWACPKGQKEFGGCGFFAWHPPGYVAAAVSAPAPADGPQETPKCVCGVEAENRSVRKEGPNCGRPFWTCVKGKKELGGCGFFEWAPQVAALAPAPAAVPVSAPQVPSCCGCGVDLVTKTITLEGPRKGHTYLTCAKGKEAGGCDFYHWVPQAQAAPPASSSAPVAGGSRCLCGAEAVVKSVAKEGTHFGRPYLQCAKGKKASGGCGFFEWHRPYEWRTAALPAGLAAGAGA